MFRIYVKRSSPPGTFPITGFKVTVTSDDNIKEYEHKGICIFILTGLSLKTQTRFFHVFLPGVSVEPCPYFTAHRFAGLKGESSSLAQSITIALDDILSTMGKRQIHDSNFSENSANPVLHI